MGCLKGFVWLIVIVIGLAVIGSMMRNADTVQRNVTAAIASKPAAPATPARPYGERIAEAEATLAKYSFTEDVKSVDDILASIAMIDVFAEIAREAAPETDVSARKRFIASLSTKQKAAFPILRDRYGPAMRQELWEADGKARTSGGGYRTVLFIAGAFAANRNIKSTHETMHTSLMKMRFTQAQYKWIDADVEYSYYTLKPPADGDVGTWSGASFSPVK